MHRFDNSRNTNREWSHAIAGAVLCVLLVLSGCAADMDAGASADDGNQGGYADAPKIQDAEAQLQRHRVDEARALYRAHLDDEPEHGAASAGLGVTELLLVLDMEEVTELFVDYLGASSGLDANAVLYDEGGYLYWMSRGAVWLDDSSNGDDLGILTLLEDELPWDSDRLASLASFVDGLDDEADALIRQLLSVANGLNAYDVHLYRAIDDSEFNRLYIPGEVFHDSQLSMQLGRSELSALRATIAFVRSAVYFLEAYEHQWTLEGAFGPWRMNVELDDEDYVPGFGPADYTVDYLDDHLLRTVSNPDRLAASRSALREAIEYLRDAIHYGVDQSYSSTFDWDEISEERAYEIDTFLEALGEALDGPTELPHTEPSATTLDLSLLFEDGGRTLDDDISWFARHSDDSVTEEFDDLLSAWTIDEEALHAFWLDGIVEPLPEDDDPLGEIAGPEGGVVALLEDLVAEYRKRFEDVYFQTR